MIEGVVNPFLEPIVTIPLQRRDGQTQEVEAVVDTGFTGFFTLPPALIRALGARYRSRSWATLADGSIVGFEVYDLTVLWDGHPMQVEVDAADTTPLVGMRLLDRHHLGIDVEEGGRVVIQAKE